MSVVKAAVGEWVTAVVHPDESAGVESAPALVTAVDGDGAVLVAFVPDKLNPIRVLVGVAVHSDQASAEKELDKHLSDVPKRHRDDPDPVRIDVAKWVRVAHRTAAKPAKATPPPAPSEKPAEA